MKPKSKATRIAPAQLLPLMDYLHGIVAGDEFEAACCYEYARESAVLCELSRVWKERACDTETAQVVEQRFGCGFWFIQHPWPSIWRCASYPAKSWNQLAESERDEILPMFPRNEVRPLQMIEAWQLDLMGVLDEFKAAAALAPAEIKKSTIEAMPRPKPYAVADRGRWFHALFTLDFSKAKGQLLQEFAKWLDLPENKTRLSKHGRNQIGKTGHYKDRLKDLAAWRLYRELGYDRALAFTEEHRKTDATGAALAFHDPRQGQARKVPLNSAPLYSADSGESGFQKAKARALRCRADLMPSDFAEINEAERAEFQKAGARFELALKVSKSSF